ncbi:hypothetical protein GGF46_003207 [Coemansia sp. RSA 552]|nr:hypothetical protein GGF46_003207 [Coemansia sp. RSA 552]
MASEAGDTRLPEQERGNIDRATASGSDTGISYAAAALSAVEGRRDGQAELAMGSGREGEEAHGSSEGGGDGEEYTTDSYTEDYSDGYTEGSVFTDSGRESDDEGDISGDEGAYGEYHSGAAGPEERQPQQRRMVGAVLDTTFSSGTTSPNAMDAANAARAAEALAPAHRFVSNTPWGSSTGRLTRDQRQKERLWDDPSGEIGAAAQEQFSVLDGTVGGQAAGSTETKRRQEKLRLVQQQMEQQQLLRSQGASADQVVNVVSVEQGTRGYSQLQQQMQREQRLQQDTLAGKLLTQGRGSGGSGGGGARIVTIAQFIKSVSRLLGIGFPSVGCTEARLTAALVAVLGVRTGLDVWFANFNARSVRAVVTYDRATLLRRLLPEYLAMMLPMAAVNQAIKWVISSLTIALRVRLGRYAHERYVDGITNISWNQLHHQGPSGSTPAYERPDWLLTVQIHRFADMFPRLLADVVKPTMDWFVFSRLLSRVIGRKGSLTMVLYVVLANIVIRLSSPPTGKHASTLSQLEEKYRSVYARISSTIQRAAAASTPLFFQQSERSGSMASLDPSPHTATPHGLDMRPLSSQAQQQQQQQVYVPRVQATFQKNAKDALDSSLNNVASSVVSANIRRFFGGIGETILAKYGATLTAYYLLAMPLCTPGRRLASEILHDPAAVMMSYSRNSAYLINLSQATTRLLLMVNDLPKFVWSTVKVDRLLRSLDVHSRYRSAVDGPPEDDRSSYTTD